MAQLFQGGQTFRRLSSVRRRVQPPGLRQGEPLDLRVRARVTRGERSREWFVVRMRIVCATTVLRVYCVLRVLNSADADRRRGGRRVRVERVGFGFGFGFGFRRRRFSFAARRRFSFQRQKPFGEIRHHRVYLYQVLRDLATPLVSWSWRCGLSVVSRGFRRLIRAFVRARRFFRLRVVFVGESRLRRFNLLREPGDCLVDPQVFEVHWNAAGRALALVHPRTLQLATHAGQAERVRTRQRGR